MMNIIKIKVIAKEKMSEVKAHINREKGFIYYHGLRVGQICLQLRKLINQADNSKDDIIYVAALFHDVAKGIEPHNENGSVLVKEILKDECSEAEIKEIANIIKCHNLRNDDTYDFPIKILQDADILDHMGTIELWMNFAYQLYEEKSINSSLEFYNSPLYTKYIQDNYNQLNYDVSKEIFNEKIEFVNNFVKRLSIEGTGGIVNK